jgi:DNA-binding SARP family transcriptional activator/ABC-type transport system substrate-binding protein
MDLRLLGSIEACLGDRTIGLGARKQRALLAMLGLEANRTVSAERLAEGLWGEEPPPSAPKMVQLYVSQLRRLLENNGATIVTHGRGYELRIPADAVDVARFERLLDESRPRAALALWRGDALADVAEEPFAAAEIRRLNELRVHAQEQAIEADIAAGRHAEVIGELEGLVTEHPLRERLHAQRMLALYRSGRQSEALEAYRQARGALVEQIGVEPGVELQRLQDAILSHDAALDRPAPAPPARPPPPRPALGRTRRRRWTAPLVAVAVLSAAAGLLAFGVSRVTAPDRLPRIDEDSVGAIDPEGGRITAQYPVGRGPAAIVAGDGSVWVANTLDGTVSRIDRDPDPDQIVRIDVGGEPTALAFEAGSLWVANGESRSVAQIDPGSNRVVGELSVGNASRGIAGGFGALWVTSAIDSTVRRIGLDGAAVSRPIDVGAKPSAIAAGAGAIWVASDESGTVTRLEPHSGVVTERIRVGNGPSGVAVGGGAVWVVNRPDGTAARIDPLTNKVSWSVPVGPDPTAIAADEDTVWVAGGGAGTVLRIDPDRPRVIQPVDIGSSASAIAIADGVVWTSAVAPPASHRGGTLRVVMPVLRSDLAPLDWLDPNAYDARAFQLNSLAYDGLVAYRRVAGAAGATLVGALATDLPEPSDNGRTYVFTLRPGLRFSDGRAVRPEDFRASIERFLQATRKHPFTTYYDGIVGAKRCVSRAGRCDLSAGIETNERARTITVHLTRPDAEFLHKLTFQFANVVPADSPRRRTGGRPPPGTGPYRIAAWDGEGTGYLLRNPHFHSWSLQNRPAGFADRIEIRARRFTQRDRAEEKVGAQIAQIKRGAADVATLAGQFGWLYSPERLGALAVRLPGQVYSLPEPVLNHMFLNVLRPPFDDVKVRRAVNFATDRARIVELDGGGDIATPTCQIVPTGFPGYRPYCPYTAHHGRGRPWTAPDMERARALVAASGTTGERVVVSVPEFQRDTGRYFEGLLGRLGYRASLRVLPGNDYFPTIFEPGARVQMGFNGWASDYASPSTFIEPNFGCLDALSHFCDRRLMREIERARSAEGRDAAERWAAIDRHVTDLAPAVPLTNRRSIEIVSARVGNVQHHVAGYTLLDQLWVQ